MTSVARELRALSRRQPARFDPEGAYVQAERLAKLEPSVRTDELRRLEQGAKTYPAMRRYVRLVEDHLARLLGIRS